MKLFNMNITARLYIGAICIVLAFMLVSSIPYSTAHAQVRMGDLLQKTIPKKPERDTADKTCRGQFCGHVFISPAEIKISPDSVKGDTVVITLELSNRTDTIITGVWKAYDIVPPQAIPLDSTNSEKMTEKKGPSLLASKDDEIVDGMTLATWLSGFPDSVVIEPHSTIKMNVTVRIPKELKAGSYTAWLGSMSEMMASRPPHHGAIRMGLISRVKITYQALENNNTE